MPASGRGCGRRIQSAKFEIRAIQIPRDSRDGGVVVRQKGLHTRHSISAGSIFEVCYLRSYNITLIIVNHLLDSSTPTRIDRGESSSTAIYIGRARNPSASNRIKNFSRRTAIPHRLNIQC